MNYFELKNRAKALELSLGQNRNKAASPELAGSTRRKYAKKLPSQQRELIDARNDLAEFVDSQRAVRGLPPRDYGVKKLRRN